MAYQTDSIDPGTSPTLAIYNDATPSGHVQAIKLLDATSGSTTAIGVDGHPLRTAQRRRGTADYDSGSVSVTASLAAITSSTIYVLGGYVVNITNQVRLVTLTDAAGDEVLSNYPLQPGETKDLPVRDGVAMVGIKVMADTASAVKARVWGEI